MLRTIRNKIVFGMILLILLIQIVSATLQAQQIKYIFIDEFNHVAKNYSQIIFLWLDEMISFFPAEERSRQDKIIVDIDIFVQILQLGKFDSILKLKEDLFSLGFINNKDQVVVRSDKTDVGILRMSLAKKNMIPTSREVLAMAGRKTPDYYETDKYIYIYVPYFRNHVYCGGLILTYYNRGLTVAKIRTFLTSGILVLFYMLIASILVYIIITRILTQPIREMTRLMSKLADGELNHLYQIKSMDEIGEMGKSVNDLVLSLQSIFSNIRTVIDNKRDRAVPGEPAGPTRGNIKNLMEDLKKAELELHLLSRKLIDTLEEERKKLAVDLHDDIGQALTALQFDVKLIEQSLAAEEADSRELCQKAMDRTKALARDIRATCSRLRPELLDDLGLVPAVKSHVQELGDQLPDLKIYFTTNAADQRLGPQTELTLYRVYQEAMNNVLKHARAHKVTINLDCGPDEVLLTVEDDGRGFSGADFDRENWAGTRKTTDRGIGLLSMKERVLAINGEISIDSARNEGTRIRVSLPAKENRHYETHQSTDR